ncbi:hypothetical protein XELAEV_18015694mg [Xenopus laevis]|uniref:Uncharacterized protein n=1 Tax=Xenopus laevis TaxID=8355 RepID=A0A974DKD7_XENLA|nr:hypothetical protein XELAEV_18015694mg [Xenopus laevis]
MRVPPPCCGASDRQLTDARASCSASALLILNRSTAMWEPRWKEKGSRALCKVLAQECNSSNSSSSLPSLVAGSQCHRNQMHQIRWWAG